MPKNNPRKTNRAPQGAGGVCKRSDGRWQGTYTIGTNPGTGKPMKKYVYGQSEKECVNKLKALQAAVDSGVFIEPSCMTVGQLLNIWTAEYLGGVKPNTAYEYKAHIKNHIKPALGAVRLQKLTHTQSRRSTTAFSATTAFSKNHQKSTRCDAQGTKAGPDAGLYQAESCR